MMTVPGASAVPAELDLRHVRVVDLWCVCVDAHDHGVRALLHALRQRRDERRFEVAEKFPGWASVSADQRDRLSLYHHVDHQGLERWSLLQIPREAGVVGQSTGPRRGQVGLQEHTDATLLRAYRRR